MLHVGKVQPKNYHRYPPSASSSCGGGMKIKKKDSKVTGTVWGIVINIIAELRRQKEQLEQLLQSRYGSLFDLVQNDAFSVPCGRTVIKNGSIAASFAALHLLVNGPSSSIQHQQLGYGLKGKTQLHLKSLSMKRSSDSTAAALYAQFTAVVLNGLVEASTLTSSLADEANPAPLPHLPTINRWHHLLGILVVMHYNQCRFILASGLLCCLPLLANYWSILDEPAFSSGSLPGSSTSHCIDHYLQYQLRINNSPSRTSILAPFREEDSKIWEAHYECVKLLRQQYLLRGGHLCLMKKSKEDTEEELDRPCSPAPTSQASSPKFHWIDLRRLKF